MEESGNGSVTFFAESVMVLVAVGVSISCKRIAMMILVYRPAGVVCGGG